MARKLEFDYEEAIERATRLFWAKGYSKTSLRELLKTMRIGESSFYNSVKSKKALYLECLRHYNDTVTRRRSAALLAEPSVKRGIRAFFTMVLDDLDNPRTPRVCLMAGSLSDDVLSERDLKAYVTGEMQALSEALNARLEAAKVARELPKDFNVTTTAQILVTYLQGLFRVIRILNRRKQVEEQIETLLKGLRL
jgi:TetR/AcrR family transcriptional regulator, transcriptional repressor for nem operon